MLFALHEAGVRLALVSSNAESNVRHVLGAAGDIVDHFACGSSLWGKGRKFAGVLRALGQPPARAISIGDEIRDIDAAHQVGLAAAGLTFGYNSRSALERHRPEYLFDDYAALLRTLLG